MTDTTIIINRQKRKIKKKRHKTTELSELKLSESNEWKLKN